MRNELPAVISRYFDADRVRDVDTIVSCFTDDAAVSDEGQTWRGHDKIRAWRKGPAAKYQYTIDVLDATASKRPRPASVTTCVFTWRATFRVARSI